MSLLLKKKIVKAIAQVGLAIESPNAYGYLPYIKECLNVMLNAEAMPSQERERLAGALGRLVTEDSVFSESQMGTILLELADEFALEQE